MRDPTCFRAVLFDVGGPIDTEATREKLIDAHIRAAIEQAGITLTNEDYGAANDWAVTSFAPDAYAAIIWRLTGDDPDLALKVYQAFRERASECQVIELRSGIPALLAALHQRGVRLGLAANQPQATLRTWVADSVHLAYVTKCTMPGSGPMRLRLTLATVSIFGGTPVVLYRTAALNPDAIDLAPGYRCVACG